jgi:TonB-like protein
MAKLPSMRYFGSWLSLALCGLCTWASGPTLEEQLRKEYAGTEQLLRHFNAENKLKFDAQGNPIGKEIPAPWTLSSPIAITKVELKDGKLRLQGPRQILVFEDKTKLTRRIKSDERFSIEIETISGPDQERQLRSALARVFIAKNEPLAPLLPDYWRDYITRLDTRDTENEPCKEWKLPKTETPARPPESVTEGRKIHDVPPPYPAIARRYRVGGLVEMYAIMDKGGNISRVCLLTAVGAGLDDLMAEAVKQWKYRPYLINGEPVEVETIVRSTFRIVE